MKRNQLTWAFALIFQTFGLFGCRDLLILQSDFGTSDGAVSAMKVAALTVDQNLKIVDITHDVHPQNIQEGAFRLYQVAFMAPESRAVFVSVVDPGVGTKRRSVVARSKKGHLFVTPDNGTLTVIEKLIGIEEVYEIDASKWRRPGSEGLHTFDGRDLYAYVGALLAARKIRLAQVGPKVDVQSLVRFELPELQVDAGEVEGGIPILDPKFGNVWTNIDPETAERALGLEEGKSYRIEVFRGEEQVLEKVLPFHFAFGSVEGLESLLYFNSLGFLSCAQNLGNFAKEHGVSSGKDWRLRVSSL